MKTGAVTFLDILGWKGIWQRKQDAVDNLINMISYADQTVKEIVNDHNRYKGLEAEVNSISDTIVLVTYGECDISLEFHAGMAGVIIRDSIIGGIPVRGATCYGPLKTNGNILVGPAIDEVASWYESSDWIGVIQTPSAYFLSSHKYHYDELLVEYEAPIKNFGKFKTQCVDWIYQWKEFGLDEVELKKRLTEMGPIFPEIAKKFINTIDFYNYVMEKKHTQ
jgi:hypothetical protein